MRSTYFQGVFMAALFLASSAAKGQIEIYELPTPARQQRPVEAETAPTVTAITGEEAVSIKLDDTGIQDWRFMNPRRPQSVSATSVIEFENQTADRTFEVTTTLALNPGALDATRARLPITVPLVVYDALITDDDLTTPDERLSPFPDELISDYEKRLIEAAKADFPQFAGTIGEVLELELALRDRAVKVAKEVQKRTVLLGLKPGQPPSAEPRARVEDIEPAVKEYEDAKKAREAADERVEMLTVSAECLAKHREALVKALTAKALAKRVHRSRLPAEEEEAENKRILTREISLLDTAVDALKAQSDETAQLVPLRLALPSVRLDDCTVAATVTCTAAIYVYPYGRGVFPREVLLYQADSSGPARFTVRFFEEEEVPARQIAYLVARERVGRAGPPKSVATLAAVAAVGVTLDPAIPNDAAKSRNCPGLCANKTYGGERREHFTGSGRIDVTQQFGNLFDGKVSIGFKEKDLGGGDSTVGVKLSQYRFNLYSEPGWTLHFGKFGFAAPSFGIAINETGEGARIAYHNYALTGIVKRESAANASNDKDQDHDVLIAEVQNISLTPKKQRMSTETRKASRSPLRTLSLVYLRGNDRRGPTPQEDQNKIPETIFTAHEYETYGGQINFTVPRAFYGSLSYYASERDADEKDAPCGLFLKVCDGSGDVGLLTLTRPFGIDEDGKSKRTVTLTVGRGSGDDPATATEDEGYIGETAGFAPDQIFLASFAGAISTRDFVDQSQFTDKAAFRALDIGAVGIGGGLANKSYLGVKVVDNSFSLLELIAVKLIKVPKADIRSRSTAFTFNDYRLRRPLAGDHDAGQELDFELSVETPRSVKVILKGGYYWRGDALKPFIHKDVWTVSSGISISL